MEKLKIELKEGQKLWFTGCTHFNHGNIAGPKISNWEGGYRNFDSIEEMNRAMFKGINSCVATDDILVHLGDLAFGDRDKIPGIIDSLYVSNIHMIIGNHESRNFKQKHGYLFSSVQDKLELEVIYYYKDQKRTAHMVCGHYPELSWLGSGRGYWMIHSHCHNAPAIRELNTKCKRFEASMDHAYWLYGEYRPFEIRGLVDIQDKKQIEVLDHHDSLCNIK